MIEFEILSLLLAEHMGRFSLILYFSRKNSAGPHSSSAYMVLGLFSSVESPRQLLVEGNVAFKNISFILQLKKNRRLSFCKESALTQFQTPMFGLPCSDFENIHRKILYYWYIQIFAYLPNIFSSIQRNWIKFIKFYFISYNCLKIGIHCAW